MQELLTFLMGHWVLSAVFFMFLISLIVLELGDMGRGSALIDSTQLVNMMNREHAVVLDVRSKDVFDNNHILGAIHVSLADLADKKHWPAKLKRAQKKPVVVVCKAGISAKKAAGMLKQQDYANVNVLRGGMHAWTEAKLPVVQ